MRGGDGASIARGSLSYDTLARHLTWSTRTSPEAPAMSLRLPVPALACVPVALGLAYVPHFIKMFAARIKLQGTYDVRYPRVSTAKATDDTPTGRLITRCIGCHQNAIETFSYFSVAVALATIKNVPADLVDRLATTFVGLRIAYTWVYVTGEEEWKGYTRMILWMSSMAVPFWLLVKAARM